MNVLRSYHNDRSVINGSSGALKEVTSKTASAFGVSITPQKGFCEIATAAHLSLSKVDS